ncbi:MAG: hypothetical protein A2072_05930 [Nitrospirae bacterium GWC1_57_7]|nr:MAG: hypothetical protein A2072_05930 [Nitrospirae bacterium GWC1_57_7]HAR44862.1 hypothetical protein [Nitrospiraceae bacterium]
MEESRSSEKNEPEKYNWTLICADKRGQIQKLIIERRFTIRVKILWLEIWIFSGLDPMFQIVSASKCFFQDKNG